MLLHRRFPLRRGIILPLIAVTSVAICGFVALAIDLNMVAIARCECQIAADCAALTGVRTLSGNASADDNYANATPAAQTAAGANTILGNAINGTDSSQVSVNIGSYTYNASTQQFQQYIPAASGAPYSLVQVTVNANNYPYTFGKAFGLSVFNATASATAIHRPRDIAMVMDMTGSMRFSSLLGVPFYGNRNNGGTANSGSNNPESVYPQFGAYSSSSAALQNTSSLTLGGYPYNPANDTQADSSDSMRPPVVLDFYQQNAYATPVIPAFNNTVNSNGPNPPSSLYTNNLGGGDPPLWKSNNSASGYAQTVYDMTGTTSYYSNFETKGYAYYYQANETAYPSAGSSYTLQGYTQGPSYWGKTFFTWPPDPTNDWRVKYFGTNDNTVLFDSNGNWQDPTTGGYTINYGAILTWIKSSPNPFPTQLRAGHILYYSTIPSTISTSSFPPSNNDQNFWKQYIDEVLGVQQINSSTYQNVLQQTGYGNDFQWGTIQINSPPTSRFGTAPYMNYKDNPMRPRTHFWFGPMTMVDFVGNYNMLRWWWPGDCHESPLYGCKFGIAGAITEAENNHPNDWLTLIPFSAPQSSWNDTSFDSTCRFNNVRAPLGQSYNLMTQSLYFPPATLNADGTDNDTEISVFDWADSRETPRAMGDTCYAYPLMLAFNQFQPTATTDTVLRNYVTSTTTYPVGLAGGMGRNGAQKLIIFETDGAPNCSSSGTLKTSGSVQYYNIRFDPTSSSHCEYPTGVTAYSDNASTVTSQVYTIIQQLTTSYSTARKPLRLYTIAFGPILVNNTAAQQTLQTMQYYGNTQSSASTALPSSQIISGSDSTVASELQTCLTTILQGSIQVVLLQ